MVHSPQTNRQSKETTHVKPSRSSIHRKFHTLPEIRFEDQALTSFSGLVVFQALFAKLDIKERLRACFRHLDVRPIFGHHTVMLLLVVHLLLGYRRLRELRFYEDDPMVLRLLGLSRLPDVATVSRALSSADAQSADKTRALFRALVRSASPLGLLSYHARLRRLGAEHPSCRRGHRRRLQQEA